MLSKWKRVIYTTVLSLGVAGCAGFYRSCSNFSAETFGSNWIIVQFAADGHPFNCWKLRGASVTNESASDGIQWKDPITDHMVHISGWYNRVQVFGSKDRDIEVDFQDAAGLLGVNSNQCQNGAYPNTPQNIPFKGNHFKIDK